MRALPCLHLAALAALTGPLAACGLSHPPLVDAGVEASDTRADAPASDAHAGRLHGSAGMETAVEGGPDAAADAPFSDGATSDGGADAPLDAATNDAADGSLDAAANDAADEPLGDGATGDGVE